MFVSVLSFSQYLCKFPPAKWDEFQYAGILHSELSVPIGYVMNVQSHSWQLQRPHQKQVTNWRGGKNTVWCGELEKA